MNWLEVWSWNNLSRLLVGNLDQGDPGGLLLTVAMSIIGIIGGTVLGTLVGLARVSPRAWLRIPALIYIQFLRNIPILIVIFWIYFVPPYLGLETSKVLSVSLALIIFTAAYIAEILRSGIRAVPPGAVEAAQALGLSTTKTYLWVILPQAFFVMIPSLTGRYITVVKSTSLAYLIGFAELTEIGREINARMITSPIEVYTTVLLFYFAINRLVSAGMRRLEDRRRFNRIFIRI